MKEKIIYLSLGILALVGVLLTGVLIQRARGFEKKAALVERISGQGAGLEPPSMVEEASPAMTFEVPKATPAAEEAAPSDREASPSAGY